MSLRFCRLRRTQTHFLAAIAANLALVLTAGTVAAQAGPPPTDPGSPPTLMPRDGAYLEGTQAVSAEPTTPDADVTSLTVDGAEIDAETTYPDATLSFDVGSNSIEGRYSSHALVNGQHRIVLGDHVDERATYDIPTTWLAEGENTIEVRVGTVESACGTNYDDYDLSDFRLQLLGETANGDENEWNYAFGDGSCGSDTSRVTAAELSFFFIDHPQRTTGLSAELDTTTLANGSHTLTARTASGAAATHTVTVNNAPPGAPRVTPQDGFLTRGTRTVFAHQPAGGEATVESLTVDGRDVPTRPNLGWGDAVFTFRVGTNSLEARYQSFLLVNGQRVELGGDYASEQVGLAIPNEWLEPGANTLRFVTGTLPTSCGDNRDDYVISQISLTPVVGTATGNGLQPSYDLGDGNCGSSGKLREAVLQFQVEGPARGLRTDLDTTTLEDGNHTIRAAAGTGEVAIRTLVTDNTAPVIEDSTPRDAQTLRYAVPLAIELSDASGVLEDVAITLDGQPVEVGQEIGPGLAEGRHVLAVSVKDALGNAATREVVFTSAGIPTAPTELSPPSGSGDVRSPTTLHARVSAPGSGAVTALFAEADIITPKQGWEGEERRQRSLPRCASRASGTSAAPRPWPPATSARSSRRQAGTSPTSATT